MKAEQYMKDAPYKWLYTDNDILNCVIRGDLIKKMSKIIVDELPEDLPEKVHQLVIHNTEITSLHGSPKVCNSASITSNKKLRSLIGGPQSAETSYFCYSNSLESLQGAPETVKNFHCHDNNLKTFMHAPKKVDLSFFGANNPVTSLRGIGIDYLCYVGGKLRLTNLKVTSHALGLMLIKGRPQIIADFPGFEIIEKYLAADREQEQLIECQHELIEKGFEDLAQL